MGGLIAATILTLTFLPALYALVFRIEAPGRRDAKAADEANSASEAEKALPLAA